MILPPLTAQLRVIHGIGDFSSNVLDITLMRSIQLVRVGVET